jgi:hypothetical protein
MDNADKFRFLLTSYYVRSTGSTHYADRRVLGPAQHIRGERSVLVPVVQSSTCRSDGDEGGGAANLALQRSASLEWESCLDHAVGE